MEGGDGYRQTLGRQGEEMACALLQEKGHTILERNWRSGHLEVDIISIDAEGIHFVEVKTRRRSIQAPPQENVGLAKQRRIASAAKGFFRSKRGQPFGCSECHFDIVAVTFTETKTQVEYFCDAYIPIYL
jgi:putative endonuclease